MTRTSVVLVSALSLLALGCSQGERLLTVEVDCTQADGYEFLNISDFAGSESGWFRYADPTPGGVPNPDVDGSNVPVTQVEEPGRCGDTRSLKLEAYGHNFWGVGFGDWAHNDAAARANGTGYDGISFWARSPSYANKAFMLNVDDSRTIVLESSDGNPALTGTIINGTECRVAPPTDLGEPNCYNGGVDSPPSGGNRIPEPGECGNSFHTMITTTESWQLFFVPWSELVQWPCPNRLDGGINPADIAKFEIKFDQGTHYELWLDNIAFYRRR